MAVAHRLGVSLKEMVYPVRMLKPLQLMQQQEPKRLQTMPKESAEQKTSPANAGLGRLFTFKFSKIFCLFRLIIACFLCTDKANRNIDDLEDQNHTINLNVFRIWYALSISAVSSGG